MQPSKLAIARSFSKAAQGYDQSALLQRNIGHQLLAKFDILQKSTTILDLGCGTGFFSKQLIQQFSPSLLVGLDLAEGMLRQAKAIVENTQWLVGDAEFLPIKDESIDFVFSNLALQWCHDFPLVLEEIYRVLKPNGIFLFTTLCEGTLLELKNSWREVDNYIHVNSFIETNDYRVLITESPFFVESCHVQAEVVYYATVTALMGDLKGIGAHNINPNRSKGLTSRKQLSTLIEAYEKYRVENGLPTTYQVFYGYLSKR